MEPREQAALDVLPPDVAAELIQRAREGGVLLGDYLLAIVLEALDSVRRVRTGPHADWPDRFATKARWRLRWRRAGHPVSRSTWATVDALSTVHRRGSGPARGPAAAGEPPVG